MKITAIAILIGLSACVAAANAAHYPPSIPVNARLTTAMVKLTGRAEATVRCFPVDDGAEGGTWTDTAEVQLEPPVCRALVRWTWLRSPRAVAVFAHEAAHIVRGMSEAEANCYAAQNIYRAARLVGFGPNKAKIILSQSRRGWFNVSDC